MMLRKSLLLGLGLFLIAGLAAVGSQAQQRRPPSREDLLDELTRHIQICSEISDTQQRLSCYDKLQTHVGDVQPGPPQPTPLASNPRPSNPPPPYPQAQPTPPSSGGAYTSQPLAPPPLNVPGGGVATLGPGGPPPPTDQDRAFDPRGAAASQAPSGPPPQPRVTRTGPRPVPYSAQPMPLVTLRAYNLTYGSSRYWQVTIAITSNTSRAVDTQVQCTFVNGGSTVSDANFGPVSIAPGEQITADLVGPPTSTYVDSTNCRVLSP